MTHFGQLPFIIDEAQGRVSTGCLINLTRLRRFRIAYEAHRCPVGLGEGEMGKAAAHAPQASPFCQLCLPDAVVDGGQASP